MLGIIAGTGFADFNGIVIDETKSLSSLETPYGLPSANIQVGHFSDAHLAAPASKNNVSIAFLARHGNPHCIPPHKVNYRANLAALKQLGCTTVIAVNAVGGITPNTQPGQIIIPHDIIDYTYGRISSLWDSADSDMLHVDMSHPYEQSLRQALIQAAETANVAAVTQGVMAVTQGPRLETPAEIRRLENDGCDIVGMTGQPEASLAKELNLSLASLCFSVNWAAGKNPTGADIHAEIAAHVATGTRSIISIIQAYVCSNLCSR